MVLSGILWLVLRLLVLPLAAFFLLRAAWLKWKKRGPESIRRAMITGAILSVFSLAGTWLIDRNWNRDWMESVTGVRFSPVELHRYESEREFLLGDGCSVYVFGTPSDVLARVTNAPAMAAANLPQPLTNQGNGWKTSLWKHAPKTSDPDQVDVLVGMGGGNGPGPSGMTLAEWKTNCLNRADCLYAYHVQPMGDKGSIPKRVRFFMIDPATSRLLVVIGDI